MRTRQALLAGLLAVGGLFVVEPQASAEEPRPEPCSADEHRQFDFWIGEWDVVKPDGSPAGRNRITAVHGGCALHEEWTSASGKYAGSSYNAYDAGRKVWHQTWVDTGGLVLLLDGGWDGRRMVLEGETVGKGGERVLNRIVWEPLEDGRVRQTWSVSKDGGTIWKVAFDGFYSRR